MTLQLEISNPQDAELILNLVRRLNIPFKQKSASKPSKSEEDEHRERRERILNFKAPHPSSFGDALEWQIKEREDRCLPLTKLFDGDATIK